MVFCRHRTVEQTVATVNRSIHTLSHIFRNQREKKMNATILLTYRTHILPRERKVIAKSNESTDRMHVNNTKRLCCCCFFFCVCSYFRWRFNQQCGCFVNASIHISAPHLLPSHPMVFFSPRFSTLYFALSHSLIHWTVWTSFFLYIRLAIVAYHFPCNVVFLYLLIMCLLFYLRILMNVFNMFFVRVSLLRSPSPISSYYHIHTQKPTV